MRHIDVTRIPVHHGGSQWSRRDDWSSAVFTTPVIESPVATAWPLTSLTPGTRTRLARRQRVRRIRQRVEVVCGALYAGVVFGVALAVAWKAA